MTVAGRDAVRRAFHTFASEVQSTIIQGFVVERVESLYDVTAIEDLDASCETRDMVGRAYVQGLKDSRLSRQECTQREGQHIEALVRRVLKAVRPEHVSTEDMEIIRQSIQRGYRTGCQEGNVSLGSVV